MTEEWRPVDGFPDYRVSSLGRVVSHKGAHPRVLHPYLVDGYPKVTLRLPGTRRISSVHSLVAEAFIGPRPEGLEVRHLDGDPLNNGVDNLRFGSHAENMRDRLAHGRHPMANKTHCPRRHAYSPENTYMQRGARVCRTCKRARSAEYKARQMLRAAGLAALAS